MKMSNKSTGFLLIGIIISFATTILSGYIIYGSKIFINIMAPTQIFMNAVGGAFFFYALKYFDFKVGSLILIAVLILFSLFYTHIESLNSAVRDFLFFFALGVTLFVYWKFISDKFNFVLRPTLLTLMLAVADAILFMGIQYLFWRFVRGNIIESSWFKYEFYYGAISGFGLGIGIEIVNIIEEKFSGEKKESLSTEL
jgi:hypothetical protein